MKNIEYLTKIVAASLLADGHVTKADNRNSHFELSQIIQHKDHIDFFADKLSTITKVSVTNRTYPNMSNAKEQLVLKTMSVPFYTKFRNRMYGTGIKMVDPHYLTLIDAEFMAIWYMQDGSRAVNESNSQESVYLYTDNFTYGDNILLQNAIKEKTNFLFSIHRRKNRVGEFKYRLYLYKKQNEDFFEYVRKYIQPSFDYKLSSYERPLLEREGGEIVRTVEKSTE